MSEIIHHPFKVGDRIHEWEWLPVPSNTLHYVIKDAPRRPHGFHPDAIVTELTARGFKYDYVEKVPFIAREGSYFIGGECFPNGYHMWFKVEDKP